MQCLKCGKECPDLDDRYCAECWAEFEGEGVNNVDEYLEMQRAKARPRGSTFRRSYDKDLDNVPDS